MVGQLTVDPKVKGLNPNAGTGRGKMAKSTGCNGLFSKSKVVGYASVRHTDGFLTARHFCLGRIRS